ncbi:MAG: 23S rRNA (uracil(1939)-C(5))-methyltransferase RlmD [Nitrosomonas sp.]|nr:23S rRNA (uracil(1939)-C(5))-methyltransferase RlmD [Nitrosomonas sp.]
MTEYHDVNIKALKLDGKGIAYHDGKAVQINGVLPGERVRYKPVKSRKHEQSGRAMALLRLSADRVIPRCKHFGYFQGACSGCALQHLNISTQIAVKQQTLENALWQAASVRPQNLLPPIEGPIWGYRHRARLSVRYVKRRGIILVGFHERTRSFVADMQSCAILPEKVSALLMPLRKLIQELSIRERLPQIEVAVGAHVTVLVLRVLDAPSSDDREMLLHFGRTHDVSIWLQSRGPETAAPLDSNSNGLSLALPEFGIDIPFAPTDFTQVNHQLNTLLVKRTIELLAPEPDDIVVDFFCGLGNFTLPLATRAQRVIGLEGLPTLVERAEQAAQHNDLAQKTVFAARNLFEWNAQDWDTLVNTYGGITSRVDRVLIDPPRAGALAVSQVLATTQTPPKRLVYISCNPDTLARDTEVLVNKGGWQLLAAGVVNMFPHTAHVESITVFTPPDDN